jgi:hypothetical protein
MNEMILSPDFLLSFTNDDRDVIDLSSGTVRAFLLNSPQGIKTLLHLHHSDIQRPSKIFHWQELVAKLNGRGGLPLLLRHLSDPQTPFPSFQPDDLAQSLLPNQALQETALNTAVLQLLLDGLVQPYADREIEDFVQACDTVEAHKTSTKAGEDRTYAERLLFLNAVKRQRRFALGLYTTLLDIVEKNTTDPERYLKEKELIDSLIGLLHSSYKNISNAIGWTLRCLSTQQEAALTSRNLHPLLLESLRLFPPNWLLQREIINPLTVSGVSLQKGDTVYIAPLLLHRSARFWTQPEVFHPQRFSDPSAIGSWTYLPFGLSFSKCPGVNLSFRMISAFLSAITSGYDLLNSGQEVALKNAISLNPFPLNSIRFSRKTKVSGASRQASMQ